MPITGGFSKRLSVAIANSGKKKGDVARSVGLSPMSLSRYLKGDRVPRRQVIADLADQIGVTVSYLIDGEGDPGPTVAKESGNVYIPDAVALTGLDDEERRTVVRMLEALQSGEADIRRHLIGQLKIIETAVQYRRQQAAAKKKESA